MRVTTTFCTFTEQELLVTSPSSSTFTCNVVKGLKRGEGVEGSKGGLRGLMEGLRGLWKGPRDPLRPLRINGMSRV